LKRLLIVSPHFPPTNAADMHRVRMLVPFLAANGWEAEVLAVSPEDVHGPADTWLAKGLPDDLVVHRVHALGLRWARIPGLGGLGLRVMRALRKHGDTLLSSGRFDLVYFSTTVFEVHILGPRWKRKFDVPFVMDYQDPWVSDYYRNHPEVTPPGGRAKFMVADAIHRWMEERVVRDADGLTAVSADYIEQLIARYSSVSFKHTLVQPFPGSARDFDQLPVNAGSVANDGVERWVYVGRGGADMAVALRGLFLAIRDHASHDLRRRLRLEFAGTSYAPAGRGRQSIAQIARDVGLGDIVQESTDRVPYLEALNRIRNASALIVPGSDDPSYTASKIYPYLLARRPLLAIFHERSTVVKLMEKVGGGVCVTFAAGEAPDLISRRIADAWFKKDRYRDTVPLNGDAFEPFSDRGSAATLCRFFDAVTADRSEGRTND
jgi:hypothetical protein